MMQALRTRLTGCRCTWTMPECSKYLKRTRCHNAAGRPNLSEIEFCLCPNGTGSVGVCVSKVHVFDSPYRAVRKLELPKRTCRIPTVGPRVRLVVHRSTLYRRPLIWGSKNKGPAYLGIVPIAHTHWWYREQTLVFEVFTLFDVAWRTGRPRYS